MTGHQMAGFLLTRPRKDFTPRPNPAKRLPCDGGTEDGGADCDVEKVVGRTGGGGG